MPWQVWQTSRKTLKPRCSWARSNLPNGPANDHLFIGGVLASAAAPGEEGPSKIVRAGASRVAANFSFSLSTSAAIALCTGLVGLYTTGRARVMWEGVE